jgi:hypothetical protein
MNFSFIFKTPVDINSSPYNEKSIEYFYKSDPVEKTIDTYRKYLTSQ